MTIHYSLDPSLRSGFRLRAPASHPGSLTPAKRLNLRNAGAHQATTENADFFDFHESIPHKEVSFRMTILAAVRNANNENAQPATLITNSVMTRLPALSGSQLA